MKRLSRLGFLRLCVAAPVMAAVAPVVFSRAGARGPTEAAIAHATATATNQFTRVVYQSGWALKDEVVEAMNRPQMERLMSYLSTSGDMEARERLTRPLTEPETKQARAAIAFSGISE